MPGCKSKKIDILLYLVAIPTVAFINWLAWLCKADEVLVLAGVVIASMALLYNTFVFMACMDEARNALEYLEKTGNKTPAPSQKMIFKYPGLSCRMHDQYSAIGLHQVFRWFYLLLSILFITIFQIRRRPKC